MSKVDRNKKGQFKKGCWKGGPGRKKISDSPVPSAKEIRAALFKAFVAVFVKKDGDVKELVAFAKKNQLNQRLLIQEVRKLLPEEPAAEGQGGMIVEISEKFMPLPVKIERIITDKREEAGLPALLQPEIKEEVKEPDTKALPSPLQTKIESLKNLSKEDLRTQLINMNDTELEEVKKYFEVN